MRARRKLFEPLPDMGVVEIPHHVTEDIGGDEHVVWG
jgi:hypothetical protein